MSLAPQQILQAVESGRISEHEADYYLRFVHHTTLEQARNAQSAAAKEGSVPMAVEPPRGLPERPPALQPSALQPPVMQLQTARPLRAEEQPIKQSAIYILLTFCLLGLFGLLYFTASQSSVGYITLDMNGFGQANASNGTFPIDYTVTGINITGVLYGDGEADVYFDTAEQSYLVARIASDTGVPRTASASYLPGTAVDVEHAPAQATYYLDDGASLVPVAMPFPAPAANTTLLIVANESGNITAYRVPVLIGELRRQTVFADRCDETCTLAPSNGSLRVEIRGEIFLNVTGVRIATREPNRPPQLAIAIPAQTINGTRTLDLDLYFADPDGDAMGYDVGSSDLVNATVDGTVLTLTPLRTGNGTLAIYASDLHDLVASELDIVVIASDAGVEMPIVNGTAGNDVAPAGPPSNTTTAAVPAIPVQAPQNSSLAPTSALDCSNPDPNLRPADCLNTASSTYFEEDLFLENIDRARVARITSLGNLVLRGRVRSGDNAGAPSPRDFVIGQKDADFNYIPAVWIDSQTGDLHLRGMLREENPNLVPPAGSYTIMNRRGVYLLYADRGTGDVYVRGNVIPYREDVDG